MHLCLLRNHLGIPYSGAIKRDKLTKGLGNDVGNLFNIFFIEFTGTLGHINLGNLQSEVGKTSADTLNNSQGEGGLVSSVDVRVLHTQDVLEITSVLNYQSCLNKSR